MTLRPTFLVRWLHLGEWLFSHGCPWLARSLYWIGTMTSREHKVLFLAQTAMQDLRLGRTTSAITLYRQVLTLEPEEAEWYYALGGAYEADGEQVRALESYRRALELGNALTEDFKRELQGRTKELEMMINRP